MLVVTSMYQSGFLSVTRWFEMTEKTQKLKPCPFCGGDASYLYKQSSTTWYVFCGECESSGAESYSETEAIAAWNRRAPQCEKE